MPDSIKIITTGPMNKAETLRGWTSSGYDRNDVIDNNPDKYWQVPAAPTADNLDLDLISAQGCEAVVLFLNNYLTDLAWASGGYRISLYADDDDSGYETSVFTNVSLDNEQTIPIWYNEFTEETKRYWRVRYIAATPSAPNLQVGGVWMGKVWDIQVNQYPENDELMYGNRSVENLSGRKFVTPYRSLGINKKPRTFFFSNDTEFGYIKSAYEDSRGSRYPFVLIEDDTASTAKLCRFVDDSFNQRKDNDGIYQPTVQILEEPYIQDGENY